MTIKYVLFVFSLFVILAISRFGFGGMDIVLIATIAGHCLLVIIMFLVSRAGLWF